MKDKEIKAKFSALEKRIAALEAPKPSGAILFDTGKYPANPEAKLYQKDMDKAGGPEKLAFLIRERTAGYPESKTGLIGCWDESPCKETVAAFMADYPQYFKKTAAGA